MSIKPIGDVVAFEDGFRAGQNDCRALLEELYHALSDALEMADDYADVNDLGHEAGNLQPNRAMIFAQEWEPLVERAGNFLKEHA